MRTRVRRYEWDGWSLVVERPPRRHTDHSAVVSGLIPPDFLVLSLEGGDEPVTWIEYYPPQESRFEHLRRVTFDRYTPTVVPGPRVWRTRLGEPA